ncbi:MAG: PAS domain S-box protein [Candidatus Zixiibacteriota bacterium]
MDSGHIDSNISDLQQAKEKIKALSSKIDNLRMILNSMGDAVISCDAKEIITGLNPEAERLTGWNADDAIGHKISKILHLVDSKNGIRIDSPAKKVLKKGIVVDMANHAILISKNGDKYHISDSGAPIFDSFGKIKGVVIVFRDSTNSFLLREKIKKSEKQYRKLYENMNEGVAIHEIVHDKLGNPVDYRITDVNLAYENILELRTEDIVGKFSTEVYGTDRPPYLEIFTKVARTGLPYRFEVYFKPFNKYFSISAFSTDSSHFVTVFEDISKRKEMEKELRRSEELFSRAFHNGPLLMCIEDIDTDRYIEINSNFIKTTGYKRAEIIGKTSIDLKILSQENRTKIKNELAEKGRVDGIEVELQKKSGGILIGLFFAEILKMDGHNRILSIIDDITERKKTELQLSESRDRLETTLNSIGDAVITTDTKGNIESMNPIAQKLTEWKIEDAIGRGLTEVFNIVDSNTLKKVDNPVGKVLQTGKIIGLANHTALISKSGKKYQIADSAAPIKDKNSNILGTVLVFRDVTKEYKMREAIRENEKRYSATLAAIPDLLFRIDDQFRFIDNHAPQSEKLLVPEKEFIGKKIDEVLPKKLSELTKKKVIKTLESKENQNYEYSLILDEKQHFFEVRMVPCGEGQVLSMVRDITEKKEQEKQLEITYNRNQALLDAMPEMMFILDSYGTYIDFKAEIDEELLISSEEIIGKNIKDAGFSEEQQKIILENIAKTIETKNKRVFDYKFLKGSEEKIYNAQMVPFEDDKVLATVRDITERKNLEDQRIRTQKLESLGTLAGGIAHDFNNILMGLFGNLSIVKDNLEPSHPAWKFLQDSEASLDMAKRLSKQLLTFSKGGAPVKQDIRLIEVLKDIVQFDLSGSNVKPVYNCPDGLWIANVDKGQIQQVFSNLTLNAKEAMPDGGNLYIDLENIELDVQNFSQFQSGKYIKITFADEGHGISENHIDKIFDPYFSTKDSEGGLGLTTVYSIIKKHGGYIEVKSSARKGTIFELLIPAIEKEQKKKNSKVTPKPHKKFEGKRALIMDDKEIVRRVTKYRLVSMGFETATAASGEEAIEIFQKAYQQGQGFDIIIMDLTIPGGKGGIETITEILKIDKNANVIVSSGYAEDEVLVNYSDYGFKEVVVKPYTKECLREVVEKVLQK